jgi:hypothetical protein
MKATSIKYYDIHLDRVKFLWVCRQVEIIDTSHETLKMDSKWN